MAAIAWATVVFISNVYTAEDVRRYSLSKENNRGEGLREYFRDNSLQRSEGQPLLTYIGRLPVMQVGQQWSLKNKYTSLFFHLAAISFLD